MKTTIEIAGALFSEAKAYGASQNLSFKEVVEAGLRQILEADRISPAQFRLRDRSFGGRGPAPEAGWRTVRRLIYKDRGE